MTASFNLQLFMKVFSESKFLISVFTVEAIHIGSLIAAQGYIFPISDHVLTLKDDGTFYRFQVSLSIYHQPNKSHMDCILAAVVSRMWSCFTLAQLRFWIYCAKLWRSSTDLYTCWTNRILFDQCSCLIKLFTIDGIGQAVH